MKTARVFLKKYYTNERNARRCDEAGDQGPARGCAVRLEEPSDGNDKTKPTDSTARCRYYRKVRCNYRKGKEGNREKEIEKV